MVSLKFLREHALFGSVQDDDLKKIRTLFEEKSFLKGEDIIREGEQGDRLYFIRKGSVEIIKTVCTANGDFPERIAVLGKGDTFGEMEIIDIQARVATVRAMERTITLSLSNKDLYEIYKWNMEAFTIIVMNLAREMSRRLRKMDAIVASSLFSRENKNSKF